jgi:hypothetical protein
MTANTNLVPELSPELQIDAIRLQMKQQRQLIEDQLTQATAENNAYPRSMTMRFYSLKSQHFFSALELSNPSAKLSHLLDLCIPNKYFFNPKPNTG